MKLQEIFDSLSYGELSQVSIGGRPVGQIAESNWKNVLNHVNLGLAALYKRFTLKTGHVFIGLISGQTTYRIHSDYSVHSLKFPLIEKYLLDTPEARFKDDIIKIERVLTDRDALTGERFELPVNDLANEWSVFTPDHLTVKIPSEVVDQRWNIPQLLKTDNLEIVYRANFHKITVPIGYFQPENVEIELPGTHLTALLYFVASRFHNPIGMNEEFHAGNSYAAKYEQECQRLEGEGLQIDQGSQSNRLRERGWV